MESVGNSAGFSLLETFGRIVSVTRVATPACGCVVHLDAAGVLITGADSKEFRVWLDGASLIVRVAASWMDAELLITPACDGIGYYDAAAEEVCSADGKEAGILIDALRTAGRAGSAML